MVSAKVEAELAEMPELEAADFRNSYGLRESGLERLMRTIYALLGRIAFFTVGEKECRAWSITRGISAQQAAGVIHTDMAKRFIRAEVIAWDKLVEYGGFPAAPASGAGPAGRKELHRAGWGNRSHPPQWMIGKLLTASRRRDPPVYPPAT